MSISEYNGGAMVAMKGKNCIAIGCDRRLGVQFQTVATNFQKVFKIQDNILLGLTGLGTDVQTLYSHYFSL
jgi:20S proteasome subunit beta 3